MVWTICETRRPRYRDIQDAFAQRRSSSSPGKTYRGDLCLLTLREILGLGGERSPFSRFASIVIFPSGENPRRSIRILSKT